MSKEPVEYLKHIRDESLYLLSVTSYRKRQGELLQEEYAERKTQDAETA